jgi:hypothetical protein
MENGVETVTTYEDDVMKSRTVNGVPQQMQQQVSYLNSHCSCIAVLCFEISTVIVAILVRFSFPVAASRPKDKFSVLVFQIRIQSGQ